MAKSKQKQFPELNALKGKIREEKSSYRKLAYAVGCSTDAMNSYLNGYSFPDPNTIEAICKELNICTEEVMIYFFPQMLRNAIKTA